VSLLLSANTVLVFLDLEGVIAAFFPLLRATVLIRKLKPLLEISKQMSLWTIKTQV